MENTSTGCFELGASFHSDVLQRDASKVIKNVLSFTTAEYDEIRDVVCPLLIIYITCEHHWNHSTFS